MVIVGATSSATRSMLDMEIKSLGGAIVDCVSAAATHLVCASGFDKDRSQSRVARRVFTYES